MRAAACPIFRAAEAASLPVNFLAIVSWLALLSAKPRILKELAAPRAKETIYRENHQDQVDSPNTTCGGTADDNNVFGEGRLDALALLQAAPVGETGTLSGTVTDEATGDPIGGARVAVDGEFDRSTTTGEDGSYSLRLPTGDYAVAASAFGYGTEDGNATVSADTVTTQDFALSAAASVTVRGTVTDGGGHGWPLYAKISIAGPAPDVWTDPTTGDYSVDLPSGATYSMTVTADLPGYLPSTEDVVVGGSDVTHDVALQVDDSTCTAPGYVFNTAGVTEDFSGEALPDGWTGDRRARQRPGVGLRRPGRAGATSPAVRAASRPSTATTTAPAARRTPRWSPPWSTCPT